MNWLQITLEAAPEYAQSIADVLTDTGAVTVSFQDAADQPIYEPLPGDAQLWSKTSVTGLYHANTDLKIISQRLQSSLALDKPPEIQINKLENQQWERLWMDKFQAMCFGKRLWVVPSWHEQKQADAITVILDPGLAFGTGTHTTTALCLEWLDQYDCTDKLMIDYGCGSGILAVAAAMLGAKQVWAVDTDPQALQASHENALKNKVAQQIKPVSPNRLPDCRADCLIANILANTLVELAPTFAHRAAPGAPIILSGILAEQAGAVVDAYKDWFSLDNIVERDGWIRLCVTRNN